MKIRVWQYDVADDARPEFEQAYGPTGPWAALFARAEGFQGTELFASTSEPGRYITVDRFTDEAGWVGFRRENQAAYDELDTRLRQVAGRQSELA